MLERFIRDEKAATAIEYALIAAIISMAAIAGAGGISSVLEQSFDDTATRLEEAISDNR